MVRCYQHEHSKSGRSQSVSGRAPVLLISRVAIFVTCAVVLAGCGKTAAPRTEVREETVATDQPARPSSAAANPTTKPRRQAVVLKSVTGSGSTTLSTSATDAGSASPPAVDPEIAMEALRPFQVLLGSWNGTSRGAKLDQPEWVWDLQTDPARPALFMTSEKGAYVRSARLEYTGGSSPFRLVLVNADGRTRSLSGDLSQPVVDVAGDGKKLERTYELTFLESTGTSSTNEGEPAEQWQIVLSQQDNNRYLLSIDRKRGAGAFQRLDTVNTLRQGTSFAFTDEGYGEKTCIISQGLGTISVSHKGQTYWVCCTGCKAAFEEDPERWIKKWEIMQKSR